jgi:hypothetical protein
MKTETTESIQSLFGNAKMAFHRFSDLPGARRTANVAQGKNLHPAYACSELPL